MLELWIRPIFQARFSGRRQFCT